MKIALLPLDSLRRSILANGKYAGGITVHSVTEDSFSYGIAVVPTCRRCGIAREALCLLFEEYRKLGKKRCIVSVKTENMPSLALHRSLGFDKIPSSENGIVRLQKNII